MNCMSRFFKDSDAKGSHLQCKFCLSEILGVTQGYLMVSVLYVFKTCSPLIFECGCCSVPQFSSHLYLSVSFLNRK